MIGGNRERVGESIWWSRLFAFYCRGGNNGGLRGDGRVVGAVGREVDEKTGDGMLMGWVGVFDFWGRVGGVEIGEWVWMGERGNGSRFVLGCVSLLKACGWRRRGGEEGCEGIEDGEEGELIG